MFWQGRQAPSLARLRPDQYTRVLKMQEDAPQSTLNLHIFQGEDNPWTPCHTLALPIQNTLILSVSGTWIISCAYQLYCVISHYRYVFVYLFPPDLVELCDLSSTVWL